MSGFLPNEPFTFINIKLTDTGRRLLSLGSLTFDLAALSDREINYGFDRRLFGAYDLTNNRVLAPKDAQPTFSNMDGTNMLTLGPAQVTSFKQISSAHTAYVGFFTGDSSTGIAYDTTKFISQFTITYSGSSLPNGTNVLTYDSNSATPSAPIAGNLVYIPWEPIQGSGVSYSSSAVFNSTNPTVGLWYRITSAATNTLYLDRNLPNFGSTNTSQKINAYVYPFDGAENYYGSATTVNTSVWNMNIVRTSSVEGTSVSQSGYTNYGSITFNGMKNYFGFSSETKFFGVVHYTNEYSGNTYAEQFVEGTIQMNIPNIMWHKKSANVGQAINYGISLFDSADATIVDPANNSTYRVLRDGTSLSDNIVGRVYHKLKVFVITDPELLTALTYKSNRNYTLPQLNLSQTTTPKYPLTPMVATGLCNTAKTYFVTYALTSNSVSTSGVSFGYPIALPCSSISKIDGTTDSNGNPTFLSASFPANAFPFLRSSLNMSSASYSGTGWNANQVQLLINEVDSSFNYDVDTVPTTGWIAVSSGYGNGIYSGDTTDLTIDPVKLQGYQFVVSRQDFNSGSTYVLDNTFVNNSDFTNSNGLFFGNESFFFGNLKVDILATTFKTTILVTAENSRFNTSNNPTFQNTLDQNTYITEIGIFNQNLDLVAIGKPTYPITKSQNKYLAFKLEYDF